LDGGGAEEAFAKRQWWRPFKGGGGIGEKRNWGGGGQAAATWRNGWGPAGAGWCMTQRRVYLKQGRGGGTDRGAEGYSAGRRSQMRFESDSSIFKYFQMISKLIQILTGLKRTFQSSENLK
jgi:hypothetical protein